MKQTNQVLYFSVFTISNYCYGYLESLKNSDNRPIELTEFSNRLEVSIKKLNKVAFEAIRNDINLREEEERQSAIDLYNEQLDIEMFRNEIGDDWEMFLDNID